MIGGLGRLVSADERDKSFPLSAVLPKQADKTKSRYWYQSYYWGEQTGPHCVAYAWTHWLKDGPVTQNKYKPNQLEMYRICQDLDEWPGNDYDGTSVRAGAKALLSQGLIKEYRWTWQAEELAQAIIKVGPVVVGTNWYNNMSYPSASGLIGIGGRIVGGHAYLLNGVNLTSGLFRIKNSWGRDWGKKGNAYISFEHVQKLLNENGEACLAVENKIINE
jgi:hypothetical protein